MAQKFYELVKAALPWGVRPSHLFTLAPKELWDKSPDIASAYALSKCGLINWDAYLESYPDVKKCGMSPCQHFLQHGIYEGRKLAGWHSLKHEEESGRPLVSIVIINFNNAHLLPKCLGSVTHQTLEDLEIIVVDDCSTDNSRDVIAAYAKADPRIRLIVNEKNSATLITRKRGVEAATGRYLMLLDSDDYMAANACEVAVREIAKGYDMVKVGSSVINSMGAPLQEVADCDNFCNRGENREYFNDEIITTIFRDGKISWQVWSFIYLREICQSGFAELPDEYITGPDDLYALLSIARRATSMSKIKDKLFFYNYGPGVSVTVDKDKLVKYAPARAGAIKAIDRYARKYSLNINIDNLYRNLCVDLLDKFLAIAGLNDVSGNFAELAQTLGPEEIVQGFFQRNYNDQDKLANLLRPLEGRAKIRSLGIFAPRLHYGGMETLIFNICSLLKAEGYRLTLFLEKRSPRDAKFAAIASIVYIGSFIPPGQADHQEQTRKTDTIGASPTQGAAQKQERPARVTRPSMSDREAFYSRLLNLSDAIRATQIDAMIYCAPHRPSLLWDMMLLHLLNIPIILWQRLNFAWAMSEDKAGERHIMEKVFANADAVICQSDVEEIYLRARGINATAIPSPCPQYAPLERKEIPPRIAFLGRIGDSYKQAEESLKVLRKVVSKAPWVSMYLIGDLNSPQQMEKYRKKLKEYGLERHVTLTGWTEDPAQYLQECGVLLSVSAFESFGLNISEAQALGLPCVIYDTPLEQTRDNPSIITVPQGDYEAAAMAILSLLEDPEKWHRLSRIALENSRKFTPDKFAARLRAMLDGFQKFSPLKIYAPGDYGKLIDYASYYSGRRYEAAW